MKIRDRVSELHGEGMGTNAIAKRLGVNPATVSYHKVALGIPLQIQQRRSNWDEIQAELDGGSTYRMIEQRFGVSRATLTLAVSDGRIRRQPLVHELTIEEYATSWNGRRATAGFRKRMRRELLAEGIVPEICACCTLGEWLGGKIPLELDHIDGDTTHNLIPNFRLLCLNCHSQTPTWRGRNVKRLRAA